MLQTLHVHMSSPDGNRKYIAGGLIFCANCRHILGYLNADGYRKLQMVLHCRCGQICYLKAETENLTDKTMRMLPATKRGFLCEECGLPLFSLRKDFVSNFTFNVSCRCGANYAKDITQAAGRKRLSELVYTLKQNRKEL